VSWILRFILLLVILRALWRLFAGIVKGLEGTTPRPPVEGGTLVRDPVCGVYLLRSRALTVGRGDQALYFCSERCRDQYRAR
jgi:hypothetical protein